MLDPLSTFNAPTLSSPVALQPALPQRKLLSPSPTHPDDYVLEIDNSSLESFTICNRKAENQLVHARQALRSTSAMDFGHLFHECEEVRLRDGLNKTTLAAQAKLISSHFLSHPVEPNDHRTAARMTDLLAKYNKLYAQDMWPERVLVHEGLRLVERPFRVELCTLELNSLLPYHADSLLPKESNLRDPLDPRYCSNGTYVRSLHILWTGRIDAVLSDSNLLFVVDHKTSREGGKQYEEAFNLANQTRGYCWAAQEILQRPIAGLMLNTVIIRAPTKTKATLPREEFHRHPYFYSQDSLSEWRENIEHIISDFVSCLVRGFFPMNGPKSFMSPCTSCDYHQNCQLPRAQRSADLASEFYRDCTWNPIA